MDVDGLFFAFIFFLMIAVVASEIRLHRPRIEEPPVPPAPPVPRAPRVQVDPFSSRFELQVQIAKLLAVRRNELGAFSSFHAMPDERSSIQLVPNTRPYDSDFEAKVLGIIVDCESLANDPEDGFETAVYLWERDARVLHMRLLFDYKFVDTFQVARRNGSTVFRSASCAMMSRVYHMQDPDEKLRALVDVIVGFASDCSDIAKDWHRLKDMTEELPANDQDKG